MLQIWTIKQKLWKLYRIKIFYQFCLHEIGIYGITIFGWKFPEVNILRFIQSNTIKIF